MTHTAMASDRDTLVRSLHDLGLAAWFGGSLMGAVGLNKAAEEESEGTSEALRLSSSGWDKWTPLNAAAIALHLVGGAGLLNANRTRTMHQQGVGASTAVKTAVTAAALAATAYARVLGKRVEKAGTDPRPADAAAAEHNPEPLEETARKLRMAQWAVPALTGALVVLNALHGEQQKASQQKMGFMKTAGSRLGVPV
ncbi:hypothetical protein [Actinorugispora endophytica]|uniref:ABC-type Mn/Zn transport systems, ATPase component n=1 Tax=Actinorugispora endophytica TaxID=1605990 RepID=A0A4V3D885_9ACTN|nr:hypothetical protein [Actinorugispora endophytica]TDQ50767.1 hypothetical protein EV190_11272 [Actinorugispora endophytica]